MATAFKLPELGEGIKSADVVSVLVKPGDARALADSMARLLEDRQLGSDLAARARQLVRERYAPEQRTRRLVEIYRGVVA